MSFARCLFQFLLTIGWSSFTTVRALRGRMAPLGTSVFRPMPPLYKKTGNLRAVQLLLGHTKMDSTVRYLGVDIEDALSLSAGIDL